MANNDADLKLDLTFNILEYSNLLQKYVFSNHENLAEGNLKHKKN
jgi:hypothetical protein